MQNQQNLSAAEPAKMENPLEQYLPAEILDLILKNVEPLKDLLNCRLVHAHSQLSFLSEEQLFNRLKANFAFCHYRYFEHLEDLSCFEDLKKKLAYLKERDTYVKSINHPFCGDCGMRLCCCNMFDRDNEGNYRDATGNIIPYNGIKYCQSCGCSSRNQEIDSLEEINICLKCYNELKN